MRNSAAASSSDVTSPLLQERSRGTYDADTVRSMDVNMEEILKKPEDAISFIETCGVIKVGEMEIDVLHHHPSLP